MCFEKPFDPHRGHQRLESNLASVHRQVLERSAQHAAGWDLPAGRVTLLALSGPWYVWTALFLIGS